MAFGTAARQLAGGFTAQSCTPPPPYRLARSQGRCLSITPMPSAFQSRQQVSMHDHHPRKDRMSISTVAATSTSVVEEASNSVEIGGGGEAYDYTDSSNRRPFSASAQDQDIEKVLFSSQEIQHRLIEVCHEIDRDLAGEQVVFVGVLTGAFMVTSDVIRHTQIPGQVRFVKASSYGTQAVSSGTVQVQEADLSPQDVSGKTVVLVEDIVDTGNTLTKLVAWVKEMGAKDVKVCVLLDKPAGRKVDISADYVAFTLTGNDFIVGYGIDYAEEYRNLPYVGVLSRHVYEK
mmetsp:Transcript_6355/g.17772  ORF Transcript_6355/g.17772 Transcript_6355/m.17772 type:complete len:289 (+) Transcript_6355:157-1023(+)